MNRREAPPLASWALEHLTSGDRDEALAGDLLEHYRAGRSDGWYWRQAAASCILSWSQSLTARGPALVFALGWSFLAPAWKTMIDRVTDPLSVEPIWRMLGPLWLPFALIGWTALHAGFLWIGLLVYQFAHSIAARPLARNHLRRAFWFATLAFPPIAGIVFLLAGVYYYSWPGLAHAKLPSTALGQITDLRILPDLIRIPYLLALLIALWPVASQRRRGLRLSEFDPSFDSASDIFALAAGTRQASPARFIGFMLAVGLMNALIAGFLVCRLPDDTAPTLASLLIRAACYVAVGAAGGVIGTYVYWQNPFTATGRQPPIPFPLLTLVCASGWVWVPAMLIFGESLSAGAAIVAMVGTYAPVAGLRRASYLIPAPAAAGPASATPASTSLFEQSLYRPPADLAGYAIALSLYIAAALLAVHFNYSAAGFLAVSAALFSWRRAITGEHWSESRKQYLTAATRIAIVVIPAILVTAWALLDGVNYRNRAPAAAAGFENNNRPFAGKYGSLKPKVATVAYNFGGYESVILWPPPQKKQIVPPISSPLTLFGNDNKQPLVIRFDGPYTYVQPPKRLPGPDAHQARGTPLQVDIHSSNGLPVVMQAHQDLNTAVPVAQCREVDVEIENRDNLVGRVSLAMLLTNGHSPQGRTIYLGQQPVTSTDPMHFTYKTEPVRETLHFAVPVSSPRLNFTGITVLLLPDTEHKFIAPRIALEQFEILPR